MNVLSLFHNYKIEEITGIETNITGEMYAHIELWAKCTPILNYGQICRQAAHRGT